VVSDDRRRRIVIMSTKEQKNAAPVPKHEAPADFIEIDLDMPAFKAELFAQRRLGTEIDDYIGLPIQGTIVECLNFGDAKDPTTGRVQTDEDGVPRQLRALVIALEKPLMVQGRDKTQPAFEAQPGQKIVFFPTVRVIQSILASPAARAPASLAHYNMGEKLEIACNHPTKMLRLWMLPTTRIKHPQDSQKRMWNCTVKVDPNLHPRQGAGRAFGQLFDHVPAVNVLPASSPNGRAERVLPATSS
jgi:hypothetical protein